MTVAQPLWLLAGVAAAVLFALAVRAALRRTGTSALAYSNLAFFDEAAGRRIDPAVLVAALAALALAAFGAAFAGVRVTASVTVRGGSVILCVDTSGSMRSTDVQPSRAAAAAAALRAFVDAAPDGTRIGLVAFASGAGLLQSPTADKDAVRAAIDALPPPNGGTAIGDALATAARALPASGRRAVVLITDGVNNLGTDPLDAAKAIGLSGIEIDTIAIGTNGSGQLVPGTAEEATIDEEALRAIAASAHGAYALTGDAAALRERLAVLARSTTREKKRVDLSLPLALGGGGLLFAAVAGGLLAGRFP